MGLLDDEFRWLELSHHTGQKASAILQKEVREAAKKFGIKLKDLNGIVSIAGPGFYTGLRLSEGFADIFQIFQIPIYSIYSYELPKLCGVESGTWMTKAYRGEYFFHHWDKESSKNILLSAKELPEYLGNLNDVYIHSQAAIDDLSRSHLRLSLNTQDLVRIHPEIFKVIVQEHYKRESFYFRAPEDEFRVST